MYRNKEIAGTTKMMQILKLVRNFLNDPVELCYNLPVKNQVYKNTLSGLNQGISNMSAIIKLFVKLC